MKSILFLLTFTFVSCSTVKHENLIHDKREIKNYTEMDKDVRNEIKGLNPKDVLLVFDIDNTILQNNSHLGSEQWFYWQYDLLKTNSDHKVSKTFDGILDVQSVIFAMDPMKLTDPKFDKILSKFQDDGFKTIILTARGPEFRSPTERSLKYNNLNFNRGKIGYDVGGNFMPKDGGREVSYVNGVYMTSGQHKGKMLQNLLDKMDYKPKFIFFADNRSKQIGEVYESFEKKINVVVYRYAGTDKVFSGLDSDRERRKTDLQWKKLKNYMKETFNVSMPLEK